MIPKFKTSSNANEFEKIRKTFTIPSKTEQSGYEPLKNKIENMIIAGKRLSMARQEMYDFNPGEDPDEDYIDPTRRLDYDMSEASQTAIMLDRKMRLAKNNIKSETVNETVSQNAQEAPDGASKGE